MRLKLTLLAVLVAGLAIPPAMASPGPKLGYTMTMNALNGSNVTGTATLLLDTDNQQLILNYSVAGLDSSRPYDVSMRGLPDGASICPTPGQADQNGDGLLSLTEVQPWVGNVLAPLAATEQSSQQMTATDLLHPLSERSIVILGGMVNGAFDPTVPVACGTIVGPNPT
jgi:hypothetical protein